MLYSQFHKESFNEIQDNNADPVVIGNLNISCLLYADDLVLLSTSPSGLQKCLDKLYEFCTSWKLEVNVTKSKVLIFNSNGKSFTDYFKYKDKTIETVSSFCYLGVVLKYNGNFNVGVETLMEKARKAYFKIKTSIGLDNPCKLLEKLFDALVKPILLYCCEVWGLDFILSNKGSEPYELLHSKFVKEILGVHCKTSNAACLSELARLPLKKSILVSSIKYLEHLITSRDSLAHDILMETYKYNPWVEKTKSCLQMLGFPFLNQRIPVHSVRPFLPQICQRATDIYLQEQYSKVMESSKLEFYRNHLFKFNIRAPYVDIITCKMDRGALAKIRLSAHKLEIERGRYAKIDREERLCKICAGNAIENETHFLWDCSKYENERNMFINSTHISNVCNSFHYLNPGTKSAVILNADSLKLLRSTSKYISTLQKIRKESL